MLNTILVIEDDPPLRDMVCLLLKRNRYQVQTAHTTEQADALIRQNLPDVILLDWMLPGTSGIQYARRLKSDLITRDIGLIMLTAKSEEEDKVAGLDSGADDYITKPFSNNELLARIRSALRRRQPQKGGAKIQYRDISIDPHHHLLTINKQKVLIPTKEFQLLYLFLHHPNRVYERDSLLDLVWGKNAYVDERTVDVYIRRLRKILSEHGYPKLITTIRGVGYQANLDEGQGE